MKEPTTRKPLERITEDMERIGDELRVRAHLAGMEAKDAWDRAHLERVGDELSMIVDEAKVQLHLASLDAKTAWKRVQDKVIELRGKVGTSADQIVRDTANALGELVHSLRTGEPSSRTGTPRQ